jgi:hypothetical protein
MKKIFIHPSVQWANVGKYKYFFTNEGKNCQAITNYIVEKLKTYKVEVVRNNPKYTLYQNEDLANKLNCTSCYAIHTNAASDSSVQGVVVLKQTSKQLSATRRTKSSLMAEALRAKIVSMGRKDRGVKGRLNSTGGEYYADLRRPDMPSVILEIDFHTNYSATKWLVNNRKKIGYAIAEAIAYAENLYMYQATVNAKDGLNIRRGPGVEYPLADYEPNPLPYGRTVYVREEEKAKDGSVWCRVNNDKQYWVAKNYLTKI